MYHPKLNQAACVLCSCEELAQTPKLASSRACEVQWNTHAGSGSGTFSVELETCLFLYPAQK